MAIMYSTILVHQGSISAIGRLMIQHFEKFDEINLKTHERYFTCVCSRAFADICTEGRETSA